MNEPNIPPIMCRVTIFGTNTPGSGWREKLGGFDTASTIPSIAEQVHEYAIETGFEPGVYVATCAVIDGDAPRPLHLYTFEVYEEEVIEAGSAVELPGCGGLWIAGLDIAVITGVRPLDGRGTSCEELV